MGAHARILSDATAVLVRNLQPRRERKPHAGTPYPNAQMQSPQPSPNLPAREIRRKVVLTVGWVGFLLAISLLLFAAHLPRWAGNALAATACTGGACIVYGQLSMFRVRWRLVGK